MIVSHVFVQAHGNTVPKRLKLSGVQPDRYYLSADDGKMISGKELMHIGLSLPVPMHDYFATRWCFTQVPDR